MNLKQKINAWLIMFSLMSVVLASYLVYLDRQDDFIRQKLISQDSLFKDMYYAVIDTFEKESFLVTLTTYNAVKEQCNNDPSTTASLLKVHSKSKYVALSRDLLGYFPYGSMVVIENAGKLSGVYVVADCMNARLIRHIDILIKTNKHTKLKDVIIKPYRDG